uniref:Uncharacterized protein n=1 Tax=Pipistrellus kuhlii TaxID=59472 RepID=A0A7J7W306_PIPKU|nr:hypothetical protein mPipKuh1_008153 [Pipistrellus kuhlii]
MHPGARKLMVYLSSSSTGRPIQTRGGDELTGVGHCKEDTIWCPFSCCAYYGLGQWGGPWGETPRSPATSHMSELGSRLSSPVQPSVQMTEIMESPYLQPSHSWISQKCFSGFSAVWVSRHSQSRNPRAVTEEPVSRGLWFQDILEREEERGIELETSMKENHRSTASCTPRTGDVPATKVHALDRNRTWDLSVCRLTLYLLNQNGLGQKSKPLVQWFSTKSGFTT